MNCPICKTDLSPLDFVSRTEHVDLCVENGPTLLVCDETGQAVLQKNIPLSKQRKICPICNKTFQAIHSHYKKCAPKNDILPDLMLDHWDQLNKATRSAKKFPRDLLESFITRRTRDGRAGEQVEYAKALLLSMFESEPPTENGASMIQNLDPLVNDSDTNQSNASATNQFVLPDPLVEQPDNGQVQQVTTVNHVLMQGAATSFPGTGTTRAGRAKVKKKFRLEFVDEATKRVNINLRHERELAASERRRYDMIQSAIEEQAKLGESSLTQNNEDEFTIDWLDRLT